MGSDADKQLLRRQLTARRRDVSPEEAGRAGTAAAAWIAASAAFREASTLAIYVAIAGEVDTRPLFDLALEAGKRVCVPGSRAEYQLEFAELARWDSLVEGAHAVPEAPSGSAIRELREGDLVIVPGVAFDAAGRRLGRGAGYYDRAFPPQAQAAPTLIGLAFAFQVVARVPTDCHDRRMDAICTEEGLRFATRDQEPT